MKRLSSIILFCFLAFFAFGQEESVAISGFDPVSYFDGSPAKGVASFKSSFQGSTYHFLNSENKRKFDANPKALSPQYGGWCAYAMGLDGSKVVINPKSYKFINGKLYLFYKKGTVDTKKKWNKEEDILKSNADKNWASQ